MDPRAKLIALDHEAVVQAGDHRERIDAVVQLLPRRGAERAHRAIERGQRQRDQQDKGRHAQRDIDPLDDIIPQPGPHARQAHAGGEIEVEPEIGHQVCRRIPEGRQADAASHLHDRQPARQIAKRRDRQRDQQDAQGGIAEKTVRCLDRVEAELIGAAAQ